MREILHTNGFYVKNFLRIILKLLPVKNLTLCFKLDVLKNFAAVKFLKAFL